MSKRRAIIAILILAAAIPANRAAARPPDPFTGKEWKDKYESASDCNACHTRPVSAQSVARSLDFVLLTEYSIWKTHDKHAQAYAVLKGPRGLAMAKILGDVTDSKTGCMNCHAMSNLFGKRADKDIDGVSCCGCHGPSQDWRALHDNAGNHKLWRLLSPQDKAAKGFRDLRDPEIKATLCMSCHIGNADEGKVVTHAMFAAGHPPLPPIEIATFTRNEPQHWRDSKDVPYFQKAIETADEQVKKIYHLENMAFQRTQLALIGGAVALRETMKLAADRADFNAKDPARLWPELLLGEGAPKAEDSSKLRELAAERWPDIALAHTDCYGCHHELKSASFRQERGYGYHLPGGPFLRTAPGRPIVREWPLALLKAAIQATGKLDQLHGLEVALNALAATSSARPFCEPDRLIRDARALMNWSDALVANLRAPGLYTEETVHRLVVSQCQLPLSGSGGASNRGPSLPLPDYETARQLTSFIDTAYRDSLGKNRADARVEAMLKQLAAQLDSPPYIKRSQRLQIILEIVKQIAKMPNLTGMEEFSDYLKDIGNKEKLAKLQSNEFLRAMLESVTNESFTEALLHQPTVDQLQRLSDAELQAQLRSLNDFDPRAFLDTLRKLGELLGDKHGRVTVPGQMKAELDKKTEKSILRQAGLDE